MTRDPRPVLLALLTAASAAAAEPPPARTLEAITIEGAVDVPQVLFITSRDNVRFDDGLGWSFLPDVAELLGGTALPPVAPAPDDTTLGSFTDPQPAAVAAPSAVKE